MALFQITGAATVVRNMRGFTARMGTKVPGALMRAGARLQRESALLVPVEFGNLKASAYSVSFGRGFRAVTEVGYTAAYALWVHEKVAMKLRGQPRKPSPPHIGRYWDPQGRAQAKFLEEPARRLAPQLLADVESELRRP